MADLSRLLATLHDATASLPDVDQRKMFGCEALFTRGAIFALVWKTGRIGVKLPDASRYAALASEKGTDPWRAGPMEMAHWLLVAPAIEADAKRLAPWVKEAHAMAKAGLGVKGKAGVRVKMEDAGKAAPSKKPDVKKPAAKKPAAKKPAAKKPAAKKPAAKKPAAKKPAAKKPAAKKPAAKKAAGRIPR